MEKKVAKEERKLMYISDLRTITEGFKMKTVPSIREIPHSSSQPILSQNEVLICYLITPRIVQIMHNQQLLRVLINVLPDESKFCLKKEKYILECKELSNMTSIFICEIEEIGEILIKSPALTLSVYKQPLTIIYKSHEECQRYYSGFQYLLQK